MSIVNKKTETNFILPITIVTKRDIARLVREFEALDGALTEKKVRKKAGAKAKTMPALSQRLQAFLDVNPMNLENTTVRRSYVKQLRLLKENIAVIHMSFAVETDVESIQRLISWLREFVHPLAVIEVHIQPALVAGVYIRTQNKVFDLSVRNALVKKRVELQKELESLHG